jgi:hypothetical protein
MGATIGHDVVDLANKLGGQGFLEGVTVQPT